MSIFMKGVICRSAPLSDRLRCGRGKRAFSLVELLTVVALTLILASLGAISLRGNRGATLLSTGGVKVANLFENARERAILGRQPVAIILLSKGEGVAGRVFSVLEYVPNGLEGVAHWKRISRWEVLPGGILKDSGTDSSGNPLRLLDPAYSPQMMPALPTLNYSGTSYEPRVAGGYGYVVFLPDGSVYQDSSGFPGSPCVLRLVEGQIQQDVVQYTSTRTTDGRAANYFEICLNQMAGTLKITQP